MICISFCSQVAGAFLYLDTFIPLYLYIFIPLYLYIFIPRNDILYIYIYLCRCLCVCTRMRVRVHASQSNGGRLSFGILRKVISAVNGPMYVR